MRRPVHRSLLERKASKYHAKPQTVDNIRFASQKEARRYVELKLLTRAGDIRNLRWQPRYALCPLIIEHGDIRDINAGTSSVRRTPVAEYVADFEYEESNRGYGGVHWRFVVEDVKGIKTDVYKLKKCWFQTQYGITIRET